LFDVCVMFVFLCVFAALSVSQAVFFFAASDDCFNSPVLSLAWLFCSNRAEVALVLLIPKHGDSGPVWETHCENINRVVRE
jgi:hypothetical protein